MLYPWQQVMLGNTALKDNTPLGVDTKTGGCGFGGCGFSVSVLNSILGHLVRLDAPDSPLSSAWEPYWSQYPITQELVLCGDDPLPLPSLPPTSRITLVHCVCDLLRRVLRIDKVVKTSHSISSLRQEPPESDSEEEWIYHTKSCTIMQHLPIKSLVISQYSGASE